MFRIMFVCHVQQIISPGLCFSFLFIVSFAGQMLLMLTNVSIFSFGFTFDLSCPQIVKIFSIIFSKCFSVCFHIQVSYSPGVDLCVWSAVVRFLSPYG